MSRRISRKAQLGGILAAALLSATASASPASPDSGVTLRLNIPAYRLELLERGVVTTAYPVAVGERRFQTPVGSFFVTRITWNPWWYPPSSPWARKDTIHPPGELNPMGPVKVQFGSLYFLHGTPFEKSIGKAASHGCVRMRDADVTALARALNRLGDGGLSDDMIDAIEADSTRTISVELRDSVPIEIEYLTVEIVAERLHLHRDIYGRDRPTEDRALAVLAAAGYDVSRVDRPTLARLVRRARSRSTSIALDSLVPPALIARAAASALTPSRDPEPARPRDFGVASAGSPDRIRSGESTSATTSCSAALLHARERRAPGWPGS